MTVTSSTTRFMSSPDNVGPLFLCFQVSCTFKALVIKVLVLISEQNLNYKDCNISRSNGSLHTSKSGLH